MTKLKEIPGISDKGADLLLKLHYKDDADVVGKKDLFDEYDTQVAKLSSPKDRQLLFNSLKVTIEYYTRKKNHHSRLDFLDLTSTLNGMNKSTAMALLSIYPATTSLATLKTQLKSRTTEDLFDNICKRMDLSYDMATGIYGSLIVVKSFLEPGTAPAPGPWGDLKGP